MGNVLYKVKGKRKGVKKLHHGRKPKAVRVPKRSKPIF